MKVREFADAEGNLWVGAVEERPGLDFKGRFHLTMTPAQGGESVGLTDVRWNSLHTARRTLETMSEVELRRRLRSAVSREG